MERSFIGEAFKQGRPKPLDNLRCDCQPGQLGGDLFGHNRLSDALLAGAATFPASAVVVDIDAFLALNGQNAAAVAAAEQSLVEEVQNAESGFVVGPAVHDVLNPIPEFPA